MNSIMRNNFLQRMLKRNDDERDFGKGESDNRSANLSVGSVESLNWSKKNSSLCTPRKSDIMATTRSPARPITLKLGENRLDYRRKTGSTEGKPKSDELPSIERIRREFEMGYMSPTKQETKDMASKSGRFVKTLVAALEEKYSNLSDLKVEGKNVESESSDGSYFSDENSVKEMMEESMAILEDTCVIESLESRLSRYLDSYVATGVPKIRADDSDFQLGGSSSVTEDKLAERREKKGTILPIEDEEDMLDVTGEETIEKSMYCSPRRQLVRRESSIRRERKPKIVGAYLKKPIEVEDTSIDWIPIIGKKLPRKKSFKRLLSILTGKKWSSGKSSKMYSSEMNLPEETTRELLQDSGYEEKSGSSSSLTSLASINEFIVQQRNHDSGVFENDRPSCAMTTFGRGSDPVFKSSKDDDYEFETITDDTFETRSDISKKIAFEDVSRLDVRLSLGPAFPALAKFTSSLEEDLDILMMEQDCDDDENNYEKIPLAPPLPKHPFISLTKKCGDNEAESKNSHQSSILSDEIKRSNLDVSILEKLDLSLLQIWKFPSEESVEYDVPRRFFSRSDPGLTSMEKFRSEYGLPIENVYDVPKSKIARRPRSSIYEDALSLKRRNDTFASCCPVAASNEFYGFPSNPEPHYATIKPRNSLKINPYPEFVRSASYFSSSDSNSRL